MTPRHHLIVLDPPPPAAWRARGADEAAHFHDECGVFGIYAHNEAANLSYLGLHALQHRGQESAGIVTTDGEQLFAHRAMGLVHDCFPPDALRGLPGAAAIG